MTKIEQILADLESSANQYKQLMTASMQKGFAALFEDHPELKLIVLRCYTPYFNDGDECSYNVYLDSVNDVSEASETFGDIEKANAILEKYKDISRLNWEYNAYKQVQTLIRAIPHEIYKSAYGEHVSVLITPEETFVTEYDHE